MTVTRMRELLYKAINSLEGICTAGSSLMGTDLEDDLNITQEEHDEIMNFEYAENKLYIVTFDWATDDDSDIEIFAYAYYDTALSKYKDIIADELNPELSWVGNEAFNENGKLNDGYEFHEHKSVQGKSNLYWRVFDNNGSRHSCINLTVIELK